MRRASGYQLEHLGYRREMGGGHAGAVLLQQVEKQGVCQAHMAGAVPTSGFVGQPVVQQETPQATWGPGGGQPLQPLRRASGYQLEHAGFKREMGGGHAGAILLQQVQQHGVCQTQVAGAVPASAAVNQQVVQQAATQAVAMQPHPPGMQQVVAPYPPQQVGAAQGAQHLQGNSSGAAQPGCSCM